jgi:membrane protein implicated in regulation of membrane protease activity
MASDNQKIRQAAFFSKARFGPGMISVLSILIALILALVFFVKLYYLAILPATAAIVLFAVKYFEMIQSGRPTERKLIGQTCLVLKKVAKNERGIVRVHREDGRLDPELWSAELVRRDGSEIDEKQTARIVGMRSIIVLIEPA